MVLSKSLLLKGLAGVAAVGGAGAGLFVFREDIFGGGDNKATAADLKEDGELSKFTQKELIDKAGLSCGLTGDEIGSDTKDCTVKEGLTLRVKVGEQTEDGVIFSSSSQSSKLKVSRSEEVGGEGKTEKYNKKLKFVVDSGDIGLTKEGGSPTITKLEQFETYEIEEEGDKFYLRRRTEAKEGKKNALGLGECTLPETGDKNCSYGVAKNIKEIRFEGQEGGITVSDGGSVSLKVTKMGDSDSDFGEDKYRFTFKFPQEVTIKGKNLKANIPYDFKIKKGTGNSLTLEQAWDGDNTFIKKAGLDCSSNPSECTVSTEAQKLNVKVGEQKREGISNISVGKIKMEKEQEGYNQGLKFTITTGDVTISDGTGGESITKLEELETYEITEEGGKYYLTRKTSKEESIRSSLSIPKECFASLGNSCTLTTEQLQNINFHDKDSAGVSMASGTATLTVSKATNTTDFPLGYKFTLLSQQEITIKNDTNKVKANVPTDFKIKKEDGSPISLEKAWSDTNFAAKVGLECTPSGTDTCCTKASGGSDINVKKGTDTKTGITSFGASDSGKIKVEKDQEGYNQGLKFTITGGNVTLSGGTGGSFTTLDEYETYEIKEEGDKYYLTRKDEAIKTIETQLGLKAAGCSLSSCSNLTSEKLQKINFNEKDSGKPTIASSGTATLTISKATNTTDFPLGYKFTLSSNQDITIKDKSNVVKKNISTDFKIKKATEGGNMSLEKAWDMTTLGKKVGLNCTNSQKNECSIDSSGGLKVKQQNKHGNDIKSGNLSKQTSNGGSGKIKVTKDVEGYNQGFKFEISEGSINLTGSSSSEDSEKIHSLGEYETYEIKEEENDGWYLVRKDRADGYIKRELKLDGVCGSENFPHSNSDSTTCNNVSDLSKLKNINFENKDAHSSSWPANANDMSLQIKKDTSLPGGFKFIFGCGDSSCCLPGSSNASKESDGSFIYQIKKGASGGGLCLAPKPSGGGSSGRCTK